MCVFACNVITYVDNQLFKEFTSKPPVPILFAITVGCVANPDDVPFPGNENPVVETSTYPCTNIVLNNGAIYDEPPPPPPPPIIY